MFTLQQFEEWLNVTSENEKLEFKEAKSHFSTDKLYRYCVAIANEGGGHLVLGVSNEKPRQVVGTSIFQNLIEIKTKILEKLHFRVDAAEFIYSNSKRVVVFDIPSRPIGTPFHIEGTYLMRSGEDLVAMTPERLRKIFDEGSLDFLSQIASNNLEGEDIIRLLDTQSYFDLLKVPYPVSRDGVLEKFEKENLIKNPNFKYGITNLGALLFAKDLKSFDSVSRKAPRVIVYNGKNKLSTRSDVIGSKGYAVGFEPLIEYINGQLPANEVIGVALRENIKVFPPIAIRELVANALIHQDFDRHGGSVVIEIYSDRIEISNPGKPFISPERFIDEYQSRNEKLADLMRRLGICEELGKGIDRVIKAVEAWQLPAPDFRDGEVQTKAILFSHIPFENMERKNKVRACYQHCCLKYVMNEKMTNQSLRERFQLSEYKLDVASRIIKDTLADERYRIKLDDPENNSKRYARYIPYWA